MNDMTTLFASVQKGFRSIKGPIWSIVVAFLVLLAALTLSLIYDREDSFAVLTPISLTHWREVAAFLLVFATGAGFGILAIGLSRSGWRECVSCFWVPVKRTSIVVFGLAMLVLSMFVWWLSAIETTGNKIKHLYQHDPGGIFAAFMGVVTIGGFALTLHDLREIRRRITTFPDLVDRLDDMFRGARKKLDDSVRFLAYTPALGYIALQDDDFKTLYNAIHTLNLDGKPVADMTCLSRKDLKEWHDLFVGRRTRRREFEGSAGTSTSVQRPVKAGVVDEQLAEAATIKGERIIRIIREEADNSSDGNSRIKRLPFEFLPGYDFFVSSERAILVAPLQLPFPKGAPKMTQQTHRTVQMLGFETNDRAIIDELLELYHSYQALPSSYVAEYSEIIDANEFENWLKTPEHCKAARDSLISQFRVASGLDQAAENDEESVVRYQDYNKYFDGDKMDQVKLEVMFRVSIRKEAPDQ